MREAFWYCVKVSTIILLALGGISLLLSEQIVTLFRKDDLEVIQIGTLSLRLRLATMPLWGYIVMSNMFTQSIGYGIRASIIAAARQGIFLIPALLIFESLIGLLGIQIAAPVSDICSFLLAVVIVSGILKQLKAMPDAEESQA